MNYYGIAYKRVKLYNINKLQFSPFVILKIELKCNLSWCTKRLFWKTTKRKISMLVILNKLVQIDYDLAIYFNSGQFCVFTFHLNQWDL